MIQPLANQADYRAYLDDDAAELYTLTLRRASGVIRSVLVGFTYHAVDPDTGRPTDPRVAAVLAEAVCAQVAYWDEAGETGTGAEDAIASSSILGVSYSRADGAAGSTRSLCSEAYDVLLTGGMFSPSVYY